MKKIKKIQQLDLDILPTYYYLLPNELLVHNELLKKNIFLTHYFFIFLVYS